MAITIREYLGDEKIAQLENMGFLPSLITDMAKRQYAADKQAKRNELSGAGLDGKLVQGIMRGEISEEEAKNAQKFEDFGSKKHGWGLGAAKTLTGIANTAERVSDFINPFYEGKHDENGNYIYQNSIEQALRPKIQNAQKMRDDYEKATGETSWGSRLAEIGTEMVGDPINFIGGAGLLSKGSKLAQFGKKTLFFAGTGAVSGGVMALGEGKNDEETLKNIGYGAAGGFVLGHAIDQGIQGISKLIAKRQASRVANEVDAIDNAQNSEFLDSGNSASGDSVGAELKEAQTMTAREFAFKEAGLDEVTAKKVVKEAMQGKEKSDWTDADTYADIVKFKNFEIQRDYAKAYGERIQTAQASINNAREQSAIRYADTQKAINEYQKQGMSPSATRELINAKFKPSADEINYTRAYNDGADVDARLAGQGIFYALEKDIAAQAYTPEIYATRLKQRGFSDESVQAFTQAYTNKDINIAKDYANSKVAQVYENKIQAQIANEIRDRDELGGGFVNEEAKNNGLSDSVSDIGDNASRTGERQGYDEEILRKGGRNTSSTSQTKRTAQSDEQMEQRPAFKTDGDTDATAASKQMVEEQGSGDNEIRGHVGQTQEEYKKLVNEYDVDKFLSDRENVLSKDARHGKSRITDRTIESNDGVGGWEYKLTPAGYEKNYKADFLTTKADVAKIRAGKMDEATFNKLKSDLESSDALGYEYKKGSEYADMEDFEREFGSLYNPKGGRNINANSHIASGLVTGTLNSIDEDGNFNPDRFAAGFLAGLAGSKVVATGLRKMTPKLYNKILGVAEKMPQMANGNPRLLGKLYSNGKDVSLNSFAGEKAITANVGKLDQAKAMLEKGANEVEIWQKTGWFKDRDGAWKFEIGDGNAKLNPGFQSGGRLGELLDHEGLFKAYPKLKDVTVVKIGDETPDGAALSVKDAAQREKRGIYNVAYNDKTATLVRQDLQKIDDALILEKGSNKKGGAVHIKKHLDPGAPGAITQDEFLSVGKNIREYLQKYKEPFIDESGGRIYEWADGNGVKFRVVVYEKADGISASHPNSIISFYSNRNLKKSMEFRNPQVKYDVNLKEWHKDSAPITKNSDGSPKTFYHGSNEGGLDIFKRQPEGSGYGFWFTVSQKQANEYASAELIPGYLKITKPFEIEKINDYDTLKNIFGLSEKAFKEFQSERQIWRKAMEKLRAREFRIADKDHLGFMLYDKNGDYVQTPNQMLVHDVHTLRDADNDELAHFVYDKYYDRYVTGEVDVLAAVLNKNDYDVGKNFLRNKLKKAGYDGIKIDDNVIVVFDSAQIKHVKNNGNFSDSPNIYKSGAEGYYDPARNEIGLSDLGDKSTLMHEAQHAIQEIEDFARGSGAKDESYRLSHGEAEARNVQNRLNLDGKAHPHETFDVNPNETIVSKEDGISYSRRIEEIKREHPNVEKELDESIATMNKESFNDSNFKDGLIGKFDTKEITTQQLGKSINLSNKQLTILKNDIKNADFKVINESKIYFDKMGKDGDKKRFFIDIAEDGNIRVDAYAKSQIDSIPIKENALQELAGVGDRARLKNMSFEVKAAYRNELDPIKKEAILKTAELNKLKKAAQSGDKVAVAKFEEFKAKNLDKDGNIKDGLRLC